MTDEELFTVGRITSGSARERCVICGAHETRPNAGDGWKEKCRRGHKPCPVCQRPLGVRAQGQARTHPRCRQGRQGGVRCHVCQQYRPIQEMSGNACIFCWKEHGEEWLSQGVSWLRPLSVREIRSAKPEYV